ncbi:MAG: tandem-95 repeat protein [Pedosphaera sp.]|nr:tandem-95 repeat protein [Pedosphaera sp.]
MLFQSLCNKEDGKNQPASSHFSALVLFLAVSLIFSVKALALQTVTLSWDPNQDVVTAGYNLYTDSGGPAPVATDVGNQTTATVAGLVEGSTYVFYVTAYDAAGVESSPSGSISYTVPLANTPPTALNKSVQTLQGQSAPVVLSGSDANGDPISLRIVTTPSHGALSGATPNVVYAPAVGFYGSDSFTYVANDGKIDSSPAVVSITVQRVNNAPVASSKSVQTLENQPVGVNLSGTDADGDPITFTVKSNPAHGTLSGTLPNLTYTPASNYSGSDSFTFTVSDGTLVSAAATVSITVSGVNSAPSAAVITANTVAGQSVTITLAGSDPNGDPLSYLLTSSPAHGTLSGTAPSLSYAPDASFSGADSFTYTVSDGTLTSYDATVTINVSALNHAPVASSQSVTTPQNTAATIVLLGSDPDGDALTYSISRNPYHGTLKVTGQTVIYTPTAGYYGSDSFKFKVSDGVLTSASTTVNITVKSSWTNLFLKRRR